MYTTAKKLNFKKARILLASTRKMQVLRCNGEKEGYPRIFHNYNPSQKSNVYQMVKIGIKGGLQEF